MMGPILTYRDEAHLERLFQALRSRKIRILRDEGSRGPAFWFRRRFGLVRGSCWPDASPGPEMYFGFGHPLNPLLWPSDHRLLGEIRETFLANGSVRIDPEAEA